MNKYALTIDVDWAPEYAIKSVATILIKNKIKCTWFITHISEQIEDLFKENELFEFGLHPNFFSLSSHGENEQEIMDYFRRILPGNKIVRTHALYQSSRLLNDFITKYDIEIDVSLFLREMPNIIPHYLFLNHDLKNKIFRIPYFWEDDIEMYNTNKSWDISNKKYHVEGLKVFNFHPTFIYLNGDKMIQYEELKKVGILNEIDEEISAKFINNNSKGTGTFFNDLIDYLVLNSVETFKMSEIKVEYDLNQINNPES